MSTLSVDTIQGKTTAGTVAMPAGAVLQVIQDVETGQTTQSAPGSLTYLTVQSVTITPKFSTSKILVRCCFSIGDNNASGGGLVPRFLRGSTTIAEYNTFWRASSSNDIYSSFSHEFLDSPSTTSSTTYNFQIATQNGSDTLYYNHNFSGHTNQISTLTVFEIAG